MPYLTEQAQPTDERSPLPAVILGGRALGMQGGKFMSFMGSERSHNDLWMTIAQALMKSSDSLSALSQEKFVKTGVAATPGLCSLPT